VIAVTLLLALAAALALPSRRLGAIGRVRRLRRFGDLPAGANPRRAGLARAAPRHPQWGGDLGRRSAAAVAGLAVAVAIWSLAGVAAGAFVAVLIERLLSRFESRAARQRREQIDRDRVLTADLVAACLAAGASPIEAAAAVVDALGGPVGDELRSVVRAVRLGADPAAAWRARCRGPGLAPLGRACARAVETGAPLADTVALLADDQRAARRAAAAEAARRAGVAAAAPLGLCFLPGFVLLGVVPVLVGVARTLFG
jgi:pilus assembly protein TadC